MRWPRPKSLYSLLLTGFALVSIPLLLGVVIAATKVRSLAEESASLVRTGVETTHNTQQLFQVIAAIERSTKLYQVLSDSDLLEAFRESRERLLTALDNIESTSADPARTTHITVIRNSLHRIDNALLNRSAADADAMRDAVAAVAPMWDAAFQLSAATGEHIETG